MTHQLLRIFLIICSETTTKSSSAIVGITTTTIPIRLSCLLNEAKPSQANFDANQIKELLLLPKTFLGESLKRKKSIYGNMYLPRAYTTTYACRRQGRCKLICLIRNSRINYVSRKYDCLPCETRVRSRMLWFSEKLPSAAKGCIFTSVCVLSRPGPNLLRGLFFLVQTWHHKDFSHHSFVVCDITPQPWKQLQS